MFKIIKKIVKVLEYCPNCGMPLEDPMECQHCEWVINAE